MEVTRGCLPDAAPSTPRFPALARVALACVLALAALAALATPAAAQTDGICGRTAQVQTAILGQISGITDCAAVTPAHLAGITGTLDLSEQNITAIAAGDFAGLTALTELEPQRAEHAARRRVRRADPLTASAIHRSDAPPGCSRTCG